MVTGNLKVSKRPKTGGAVVLQLNPHAPGGFQGWLLSRARLIAGRTSPQHDHRLERIAKRTKTFVVCGTLVKLTDATKQPISPRALLARARLALS